MKPVTEVTYLSVYYLSFIRYLIYNGIVVWQVSKRNDVKLVLYTGEQWTPKRDVFEAVLHSNQGFQYASQAYNTR
ncbi:MULTISPECIES: hypothetical protein [Paenibacillus]|uniref:Integrase n=2 Tax=Paenibacillus lactis TaxID=228574 RepID=G4HPU8_9BACL|nr:hypothetical protein [Paenibacillus lactis]EHB47115.1 integrase [Paenibacillus lactis 154]MBP1896298.1 putative membrane protein [Paenibacillus lactis]MCM3497265.1 hypothetical protein [Paenibacillus lactis]HAG00533.1 hypothetical protein [Paenibacillus lactis]